MGDLLHLCDERCNAKVDLTTSVHFLGDDLNDEKRRRESLAMTGCSLCTLGSWRQELGLQGRTDGRTGRFKNGRG
jgi:hypothetical protein